MGEECACRKWKEDVYWNNFHCLQFFQTLSGHFHQHLAIPKKFAQNMSEALSETIVLKSPTGATWTVGLSARGDTLFLEKGWKEFIEDNSLVEDDVLLFKYNRGSHFEIQMFDGQSLCEKEASYFVGKCYHSELENTGGAHGNCTSLVISGEFSASESKSGSLTERTTSEAWTLPSARSQLQPGRKIQKPATSTREMSRMITGYPVLYQSRRRSVTEDEKRNALELANAALHATEGSCIVVMRSSHVYKGFYLSIPTGWAANHLPGVSHVVVLRVPNDTRRWTTKYQNKGRGCGLTGGWKKFARENFLEESDVCLFKIASETNNDSIVMDVTIFRVVAEVIAATRRA